jgi:Nitrate and nitrite sensing
VPHDQPALLPGPPAPPRPVSRAPLVVGGVLLAMLLVAAAFAVVAAIGAFDDLASARRDVATAGGSDKADDLIAALQAERAYSALYLLGSEDVVDVGVDSLEEATGATDEALAAFRSEIGRAGGALTEVYTPVLSDLDAPLADLRQRVAAWSGPRDMSQRVVDDPIYAGYTSQLDALAAAGDALVLEIDDTGLREGAQMLNLASDQRDLVTRLGRELVLAGVSEGGALDTPDEITPVARDRAALMSNEVALTQLADVSDYPDAAAALADQSSMTELSSLVQASLEGEPIPLSEVTAMVPRGDVVQRYAAFEVAVQTRFDARADDIQQEAELRRLLWIGLAAAAGVCLAITLVVLVR